MDIGPSFVANRQPSELADPGERPFDYPPVLAQPFGRLHAAPSNARHHPFSCGKPPCTWRSHMPCPHAASTDVSSVAHDLGGCLGRHPGSSRRAPNRVGLRVPPARPTECHSRPSSGGVWSRSSPGPSDLARSLRPPFRPDVRGIHGGSLPVDLPRIVQGFEQGPMQSVPYPKRLPFAQPAPAGHPTAAAHFPGKVRPTDTCLQDELDPSKCVLVWNARTPSIRLRRWRRQKRGDSIPKLRGQDLSSHPSTLCIPVALYKRFCYHLLIRVV